jgi:serine/threonine-protein kinase RsbW
MKKIIVPGRLTSLETIHHFYSQAAAEAELGEEAIYEIQVAIDEAVANIIDHAYGGEIKGDIECGYEIISQGLRLILRDHGKPFNPDEVEPPDILSDPCKRKQGGLGLFFIRQMMDEVKFSFNSDGGNVLTMVKYREKKI